MTYQITVPKIHCSGCVNLIKMTLEEVFKKVEVDQSSKVAEFSSDKELNEVQAELNKAFVELREIGYEYVDLKKKD